jgi:hypothetical protein
MKNSKVFGSEALGPWVWSLAQNSAPASDNVFDWAQAIRTMATDSDHQKIAEHALAMLKGRVLARRPRRGSKVC